jgi:large subunit ribosomal protein L9
MELILKETIDNLGEEGDIVTVKAGYARNYLLPRQKAVVATEANRAVLEQQKASIEARKERQKQEAEALAKKLSANDVVIEQRSGDEDRLFGSVTNADIAEKLAEMGIEVDRKSILLHEPIKTLGETVVSVKTGYQMTADLTVKVVPLREQEEEQAQEQAPAQEEEQEA